MSEGKLKLKRDRKRKAEQDIDRILGKNSLDALHEKCRETIIRKKQLSTSTKTAKIKENLLKVQEELKNLKKRKKRIELEENTTERKLQETLNRINDKKNEIEENVFDFMGKRILIKV